jgi:hypothetical protein
MITDKTTDTNERSPSGEFVVIAMQKFSPMCLFQACFLEGRKAKAAFLHKFMPFAA